MATMTIRTGCGRAVSIYDGSAVHALLIKFDWMRERNFVSRKKLLVAMTGSACVRQIFFSNR